MSTITTNRCDRCGETVSDLDAGFSPALHGMRHDCGGTWRRFEVLATPDGDPIVAWGSYGSVRGYGPLRSTKAGALADLRADAAGCRKQRGYSDRSLVAVDARGRCWSVIDDEIDGWMPGPGGRSCGAARYSETELKEVIRR